MMIFDCMDVIKYKQISGYSAQDRGTYLTN